MSTGIQWTDETWNPVSGCTKVSAGCKNCYAETVANRKLPRGGFTDRPFTEVRCHPDRLDAPLHWRKPRRVFVNSMSDLFHESVPDEFISRVFGVMGICEEHTFQVLTKRPERMAEWISSRPRDSMKPERAVVLCEFGALSYSLPWPLPNVWLGVSVENQATADERIPLLLQTPAAVRFVSYEPALGPVDFNAIWPGGMPCPGNGPWTTGIDWLIVGGESGPGARQFTPQWARDAHAQCRAAGVPFFMKQFGSNHPHVYMKDRKGGNMDEWPEDMRVREFPKHDPPVP